MRARASWIGILMGMIALPVMAGTPAATKAEVAKASALTLTLEKGDGTVGFLAVGRPGFLKIHGTTEKTDKTPHPLKGELKIADRKVSGTATYALDALDTGIGLRTQHMKEKYLQTEKFPTATMKITKLELPESFDKGDMSSDGIDFQGDLTLHGQTKAVSGKATVERKGQSVRLDFEFPVVLTDYGVEIPSFSGITVAKDVTVTVKTNTPSVAKAAR